MTPREWALKIMPGLIAKGGRDVDAVERAIRAACAERDAMAVEFIRTRFVYGVAGETRVSYMGRPDLSGGKESGALADALAAHLAQNGGGK